MIVVEDMILDITDLKVATNTNEENNCTLFGKNFTPESQMSEKEASKMTDTKNIARKDHF
jgi:hypothetical protein